MQALATAGHIVSESGQALSVYTRFWSGWHVLNLTSVFVPLCFWLKLQKSCLQTKCLSVVFRWLVPSAVKKITSIFQQDITHLLYLAIPVSGWWSAGLSETNPEHFSHGCIEASTSSSFSLHQCLIYQATATYWFLAFGPNYTEVTVYKCEGLSHSRIVTPVWLPMLWGFSLLGEGSPRAALLPHLLPWICPPHPNIHTKKPPPSSSYASLLPAQLTPPAAIILSLLLPVAPQPTSILQSEHLLSCLHHRASSHGQAHEWVRPTPERYSSPPPSPLQTHPKTVTVLLRLRGEVSSTTAAATTAQAINCSGRPNGRPGSHNSHHCCRLSKPCCNFQQSISSTEPNSDDNLRKRSSEKSELLNKNKANVQHVGCGCRSLLLQDVHSAPRHSSLAIPIAFP